MKLHKVKKPLLEKKLAYQDALLLYSAAWLPQGIFFKKSINRTPR
jgi:TRAP-type transport system periplasmic protein